MSEIPRPTSTTGYRSQGCGVRGWCDWVDHAHLRRGGGKCRDAVEWEAGCLGGHGGHGGHGGSGDVRAVTGLSMMYAQGETGLERGPDLMTSLRVTIVFPLWSDVCW